MRFFARGIAQVNTPNATVMDLCKLKKLPFFAKDTAQVNTPNATVSLRSEICRIRNFEVVVRTPTSRPFRPLGHIYQAITL